MIRLFIFYFLLNGFHLKAANSEMSHYFAEDESKTIIKNHHFAFELGGMYGEQYIFNHPYKNNIELYGLTGKLSSAFYFSEDKLINPFFKVTWARIGLGYASTPFVYITPLNIGIGTAFKLNDKSFIDLGINGGVALAHELNFPYPISFITPIVVSELKYRYNDFAIAAEFTFRKSLDPIENATFTSKIDPAEKYFRYLYWGLNFEIPLDF